MHPATRPEVSSVDCRHPAENVLVADVVHVREARSAVQRTESPETIKPTPESDHAETPAISAPPGVEKVAGPDRKPAEAAPATVTKSEAKAATPSPERHIRRRPERTVETATIQRSRPPGPGIAVIHPAPVVIRRPAPGLVANPGPPVIGLIGPVAVTIGSPVRGLVRNPHIAVVRYVFPAPVRVEILGAGVVAIGVLPRAGVADHVVAVAVPCIPLVAIRSGGNLVLRGTAVAAHRRHFSGVHFRAALRRGNLCLPRAHD